MAKIIGWTVLVGKNFNICSYQGDITALTSFVFFLEKRENINSITPFMVESFPCQIRLSCCHLQFSPSLDGMDIYGHGNIARCDESNKKWLEGSEKS